MITFSTENLRVAMNEQGARVQFVKSLRELASVIEKAKPEDITQLQGSVTLVVDVTGDKAALKCDLQLSNVRDL